MRVFYFFIGCLLFQSTLTAQPFQKKVFGVNEGLSSLLIKTTAFDSLGFLWIGTDEGLVRYDGQQFLSYPKATPSRFIKRIQCINNKLYVISDLGVTQINADVNNVTFDQVYQGSRAINDSTLWYPKDLFRQSNGHVWISEPGSVVRLINGQIKRYEFSREELSSSFFRSFSFFEFNDQLYILSFTGHLYRYDIITDSFLPIQYQSRKPLFEVYQTEVIDSVILVGDANGVHSLKLDRQDEAMVTFIDDFGLKTISIIKKYEKNKLIIGDFGEQILIVGFPDFNIIRQEKIFRSNGITLTPEKNIWVSSDEGLVLLKRNFFNQLGGNTPYVESIDMTSSLIYYCHKDAVFSIVPDENEYTERLIFTEDESYFLFLKKRGDKLWLSNKWKMLQLDKDYQKINEIDFSSRGLFIFNFEFDDDDNLWLCQDNVPGLLKMDRDGNYHEYQADKGLAIRVIVVKKINGKIYAGGSGNSDYLFVYDEKEDRFKNISLPVEFKSKSRLEVNDIMGHGDTLWLATTAGVFKQYSSTIEQLKVGELSNSPAKSIAIENNYLWFSNTYGIVRVD
ncbi:MAG: hypothetical protein AAFN93_07025, partial [Bacteroidota bacterium]